MTPHLLLVVQRGALFVLLCALGTGQATELHVELLNKVFPENAEIFQGDTVVWHASRLQDVESYTGEWKSPILNQGESYSYTFTTVGKFLYRNGWYNSANGVLFVNQPGSVTVRPLEGPRPAVSIVSPPDGYMVHELVPMEALVTNAPADVQAVHFFRGEELFDTATNAPYRTRVSAPAPGRYEYRAVMVDQAGHTNTSPSITLTIPGPLDRPVFNPTVLPGGRFAFNYSLWRQGPVRPLFSWDLSTNVWRDLGSDIGLNLIVSDDRRVTNALKVFFKVDRAPL